MRKSIPIVLAAVIVLAALVAGWPLLAAEEKDGERPAEGPKVKKAFAFTLNDQSGNPVTFSQFRGKIVVLEWVNFDCEVSKRHYERGTFNELAKKYCSGKGKKQKAVWLAINSTHYADVDRNKAAASKYKVRYSILDDHESKVGRIYRAKTTPHIFIKAADGAIVYEGAVDDDPTGEKEEPLNYIDQALGELIEGKAVSVPKTDPYGTRITYPRNR